MTVDLILCRHGDTFSPGDPVVWVGSANDLKLTEKGVDQARQIGKSLLDNRVDVAAILCGPLQRTRSYANTIVEIAKLNLNPIIDPRLNELDYGSWSGLTSAQIEVRYGKRDLEEWNANGVWPANAGWGGSPEQILDEVKSLSDFLLVNYSGRTVIAVTSNGRLRYFLRLVPEAFERIRQAGELKVRTGAVCRMTLSKTGHSVTAWNAPHL